VGRVLKKDAAAGDEFFLRYRDRIYAVAVAVLGWRDPEAEDVVHETFAAALQALEGFEFRSTLYTWLNQICVRQCYKRIRSRSRMALGSENDLAEALGARPAEDDGALKGLDEERKSWLKQAVQALDEGCRRLIELRDLKGISYGEASRQLKVPIGTVMSRLSRCREKLKSQAKAWMNGADGG
jgi:RNA polymerase sigma-70 factor (ECF subfamily)